MASFIYKKRKLEREVSRIFHKIAEICNNGNIGITDFFTRKKNPVTNVTPLNIDPRSAICTGCFPL